jgi:hypothetical protein
VPAARARHLLAPSSARLNPVPTPQNLRTPTPNAPVRPQDFRAKLDDPTTGGAVFFAVARGKVQRGLGPACTEWGRP